MTNSSSESLIMNLLEQIRGLEAERDSALQLANELQAKEKNSDDSANKDSVCENSSNDEEAETKLENLREENEALKGAVESMTETLLFDLEEIRLNEEQRRFNLKQLATEANGDQASELEEMDPEGYRTMLDMCKKYYGKMVAELQEERNSLQQKIETQQAQVLEKDIKIAELEMKLLQLSRK
ncbi:uncharacterized protein [Montipora capricornis]|uniref:uncharacterized protein n=1 Tax=Montipora capricornis TaxID=246305 RepID=UPI0035F17252